MFASQAYGSFAKWYIANLKAKPYLINAGSGLILMSAGDVIAQKVQIGGNERQQQHQVVDESEHQLLLKRKRQRIKTEDLQQQRHINNGTGTTTTDSSAFQQLFLNGTTAAATTTTATTITDVIADVVATSSYYKKYLNDECAFWDKSRTAKMAAWSVLFTPFYVGIYKTYDRYLPKRTPASIVARVGLSFLASVPINFAFYTYGNFVQHTADWYTEQQNQQQKAKVVVPYRFDQLVEKTKRKLDAELFNTIKTSATFWIPINFLSFSIVPSHIQPLSLMFFSVFWNCYLSMSQHREIEVVAVTTSADEILQSSSSSSSSSSLLRTAQVIATSSTTTTTNNSATNKS
jgi:hypothetical protein